MFGCEFYTRPNYESYESRIKTFFRHAESQKNVSHMYPCFTKTKK